MPTTLTIRQFCRFFGNTGDNQRPAYVFDETLTLLRYRLDWQVAHTFGEQLLSGKVAQLIRVTEQDEQAAWEIFSRYQDKSLSFTDCSSFAVIKRLNIEMALAVDSDFRAYGLHCVPYLQVD
jgi:predicted nucleic acid-binding protein